MSFLAFQEGIGVDGSKAVKVKSFDDPVQDWDTQFFIRLPYQLPADTRFRVSFDYKANKAGDFDTHAYTEPDGYIHNQCIGNGSFTDGWQTYEKEGVVSADMSKEGQIMQTIAINLAKNREATEFIFDNVKFLVDADIVETLTKNEAVNPKSYPVELAAAKALLLETINKVKALECSDYDDAVNSATVVLRDVDAKDNEIEDAMTILNAALNAYTMKQLVKIVEIADLLLGSELAELTSVEGYSDLNALIQNAKTLLSDDEAPTEEMAAALQAIQGKALPVLDKAMEISADFCSQYGNKELSDAINIVKSGLSTMTVDEFETAIIELAENAKPFINEVMDKLGEYVYAINDNALANAIPAAYEALNGDNFLQMIAAINEVANKFINAAPAFLQEVERAYDADKNLATELRTALDNAQAVLTSGSGILEVGEAIKNLIKTYKEYLDANFDPMDCTSKVRGTWLSEQGSVSDPLTIQGAQSVEQYNGNTVENCDGDVLYQLVTGLENGTYTVEIFANASFTPGRGFTSPIFDGEMGRVVVYAGDVEHSIPAYIQDWPTANNIVRLENVVVSDRTLRMGIKKLTPGTNWHSIAIKTLTLVYPTPPIPKKLQSNRLATGLTLPQS